MIIYKACLGLSFLQLLLGFKCVVYAGKAFQMFPGLNVSICFAAVLSRAVWI